MKIRQNLDLNTCKNITTDCTAYKWWSTESTRSKHYFAINNLSALSIVSFLLTQNHFTDGNFLHLASFSIKLQGDTYFHDMTLIYFSRYLYIPSKSYVKCQIKSKIIAPPYLWVPVSISLKMPKFFASIQCTNRYKKGLTIIYNILPNKDPSRHISI